MPSLGLSPRLLLWFGLLALALNRVPAAANPNLPRNYADRFATFEARQAPLLDRMLQQAGFTSGDIGRSFALVVGVSRYPEMRAGSQDLPPAAVDVARLVAYLKQYENFEEIVVLENAYFSEEMLRYFLVDYFPQRMRQFPRSRFLFAFSGHGMTEDGRGYLLFPAARHLTDSARGFGLDQMHRLLEGTIRSAHHSLVLINSCYSGTFRQYAFGGTMIPRQRGAHAITAGGSQERAWGTHAGGSIFFEKLLQGLGGDADVLPVRDGARGDGIITVEELFAYLKTEVQISTDQRQNPQLGNLSYDNSGGFFFFNRKQPVRQGLLAEWIPGKWLPFGANAESAYVNALQAARERRISEAVALLREAADLNHRRAIAVLAAFHSEGIGVPQNAREAFRLADRAARLGDAEAMAMIGYMHANALGTGQNLLEAARWYQDAAVAGSALAAMNLSLMHSAGEGVAKNDAEAFRWMRKGVELGDYRAMGQLGLMYYRGRGTSKDIPAAGHWLRKAALADGADEEAMTILGFYVIETQKSVAADQEAVYWFGKAAQKGYPTAMRALAFMYSSGRGVARQDDYKAHELYLGAAKGGDVYAMHNLGLRYLVGQGTAPSSNEAVSWLGKAADAGMSESMTALGRIYWEGKPGIPRQPERAVEWFKKGATAQSPDPYSMFNLGFAYSRGVGVTRNRATAAIWFGRAADHGVAEAQEELRKLQ